MIILSEETWLHARHDLRNRNVIRLGDRLAAGRTTRTYTRAEIFWLYCNPQKAPSFIPWNSRESAMKCGRHFLSVQPAD